MEYQTKRGIEVKINVADFMSSMRLKKSIAEAAKDSGVDIAGIDFNKLGVSTLEPIIQAILSIDSSDKVEDALFNCLKRCTYNGEKIIRETFEPVEVREDYYEIVINCLKVNLLPFFQPLLQKLKDLDIKKSLGNPK